MVIRVILRDIVVKRNGVFAIKDVQDIELAID